MKNFHDFPIALCVLADHLDIIRQQPYWSVEVFGKAVVYLAINYSKSPKGPASCFEANSDAMEKHFPEALPIYRDYVKNATDYDMAIADLAGFEFRSSLCTAESINDLLGHLRGRRSVRWTSKDIHKAAVVTNGLMAFLKEIPSGDVDINAVINKIRVDVEARLAGVHGE